MHMSDASVFDTINFNPNRLPVDGVIVDLQNCAQKRKTGRKTPRPKTVLIRSRESPGLFCRRARGAFRQLFVKAALVEFCHRLTLQLVAFVQE